MIRLSPEQLNKIWVSWLTAESVRLNNEYIGYHRDYTKVARGRGMPNRFEEWLWMCGGQVWQSNKCRYVVFDDDVKATYFVLTYL